MDGCLKGVFRLGCLAAIVVAAFAVWWFRDPIGRQATHWFGRHSTALPPVADTSVGAPTPTALASAEAKLEALGQRGGPDSVLLNANEVASLIGRGIDCGFPFPAPAVRAMTHRLAGADSSGGVAVQMSPGVARIVVGPVGVILYRHARR